MCLICSKQRGLNEYVTSAVFRLLLPKHSLTADATACCKLMLTLLFPRSWKKEDQSEGMFNMVIHHGPINPWKVAFVYGNAGVCNAFTVARLGVLLGLFFYSHHLFHWH